MFNGKLKAVTFSYDDGVTQDIRLIELFDKYNIKGTFNLNSALLGKDGQLLREGKVVSHKKNDPKDIINIYKNHEVAAHTLTHPFLPELDDNEIINQVENDRLKLSEIVGYEVIGMAYPGGGVNNNDRVAKIIKDNTGIKYARTTTSTYNFDLQSNLYRFNPTVYHHGDGFDKLTELGKKFIELKTNTPKIFYIWGHSYEFDIYDDWDKMEGFLKLISGHEDIFYGTNSEILLSE